MKDADINIDRGNLRLSGKVSSKLKSTGGWNNNANGTNKSGFNALPGGWRDEKDSTFNDLGDDCDFWTATEYDSSRAWARLLVSYYPGVTQPDSLGIARYFNHGFKEAGRSVRCVKNKR